MLGPVPFLARASTRLFLTSAGVLFAELVLIRWIPSNVIYIGFFSNFLLMGSFLGIGTGILLGRRLRPASPLRLGLLFFTLVAFVLGAKLEFHLDSSDEIFFGLTEAQSADVNFLVLPLATALVTAVMAAISLPLGALLRAFPPLRAYAIDIAGSLAGIALFAALSFSGSTPAAWFATLCLLLVLPSVGHGVRPRLSAGAVAWAAVIALNLAFTAASDDRWSPYYRITLGTASDGTGIVSVNGIPHQSLHKVRPGRRLVDPFYEQVYSWFPGRRFDRALIVGAGSGTDAAYALAQDTGVIDAVEIDPVIAGLGRTHHPDRPYADTRVRVHINDGRAFLRFSPERYDLIVFALADSVTLVSSTANIRLESFLFTREAFMSVRDHLRPDGLFVLYNYFRQPWLAEKIAAMLEDVFGVRPLARNYSKAGYGGHAVVLAVRAANAAAAPPTVGDEPETIETAGAPAAATDDWPFIYLRDREIPSHYLVALTMAVAGSVVAVWGAARARGGSLGGFSPHFFVLGSAFLLLETRSLVLFGLLFGTTWVVNALVFAAILASVLLAIALSGRLRMRDQRPLFAGLFGALILAYLFPPVALLFEPAELRYAAAAAIAFAPIFFANLVFAYSFRDTAAADMAFASNVLGAIAGGVLEYAALVTGYQALIPLVGALYLAAYLLATRWRFLADHALRREA